MRKSFVDIEFPSSKSNDYFYFDEQEYCLAFQLYDITYIIDDLCTLSLLVLRGSCRWVNGMTRDIVHTSTQSCEGIILTTIFISGSRPTMLNNY